MAYKIRTVFVLTCLILICDCLNLEDTVLKCSLIDDECHKKLYGALLPAISSGALDIGVKPIDPLRMSNITVSVLDMVDFTLVDGTATGIKNCEIVSLTTHIERKLAALHINCKIKTEGKFKVLSSSPVIEKLFGYPIEGEGDGTLILDDFNMFFELRYNARKGDDGENYLKCSSKEINYKYVFSGKTELIANNLVSNSQDANDFILNFLEENSSFIKASIGSAFVAKAKLFYFDFCDTFFNTVPAKKYVLEDLTPFIKN